MSTTYAPGPWILGKPINDPFYGGKSVCLYDTDLRRHLALIAFNSEMERANARVMLSAPDLHAALLGDGEPNAVDWIEALLVTFREDCYDPEQDTDRESTALMLGAVERFIRDARAAMEKIDGRRERN